MQKLVAFLCSTDELEFEITKIHLHEKNKVFRYKTNKTYVRLICEKLQKSAKKNQINGEIFCGHEFEYLLLLTCQLFPA